MTRTEGDESDYRPISCDTYSEYELAIMHRQHLRLTWHEANVCFTLLVMPLDLETDNGEEFLHCALPSGERARVRLDRIQRMEPA